MKLSAQNIVAFINQLDKKRDYNYLNPRNKGLIRIDGIDVNSGTIRIIRWDPSKGQNSKGKKVESISKEMIWRIANNFSENQPINFDRVLGGSYNTRSVLETLLAHTSQFYYCYPGRIEDKGGTTSIKKGHKHLMWVPDRPHSSGNMEMADTEVVISELPSVSVYHEPLTLPDSSLISPAIDIAIQKRHAQIQFLLYKIGHHLGFRTWIAQNDKGIKYLDKKFGEYEGVISNLKDDTVIHSFADAIQAALLIDCIWFKNGKLMPAVMEIEHSTGVTSGLTRMKGFKDKAPPFPTRYVIVASDDERDKVYREANRDQFRDLNSRYFSYSAVEELFSLCERRKIRGVTEDFLDSFMEQVVIN